MSSKKRLALGLSFVFFGLLCLGLAYSLLITKSTTVLSQKQLNTETTKKPSQIEEAKDEAIRLDPNLKYVDRDGAFLFTSDQEHPLKTRLLKQAEASQQNQLTATDLPVLYFDNLTASQLLIGDPVKVIEVGPLYSKVAIPDQISKEFPEGYQGYMFNVDLADNNATFATAKDWIIVNQAHKVDENFLSVASKLPLLEELEQEYLVALPSGDKVKIDKAKSSPATVLPENPRQLIVETAKSYLNLPFVWGGIASDGLDCSGLIYQLYRMVGITLARDNYDQVLQGKSVSLGEAQPGDVMFFKKKNAQQVYHIALYLGNNQIIHALNTTTPLSISNFKGTVWEWDFYQVRSYL